MKESIPFIPDKVYHIYNRAVGGEVLFREKENYSFFIQRMRKYLSPVMDIYTYSLIPNHFHIVAKIKDESFLIGLLNERRKTLADSPDKYLSDLVVKQIGDFLNSYVKSFNKRYRRMGSLLMAGTKRSLAEEDYSEKSFILYVHKNAVHHGLTKNIGDWPHDGYNEIVSNQQTWLKREAVFAIFGTKDDFIASHKELQIEIKKKEWDV